MSAEMDHDDVYHNYCSVLCQIPSNFCVRFCHGLIKWHAPKIIAVYQCLQVVLLYVF